MPTRGVVAAMAALETNGLFFEYVKNELIPSIREDGQTELAKKLERLSQPIQVKGFGKKILRGLRHGFTYGSELEDRKKYFLEQLYSSAKDEKTIVNRQVRSQIPGPYYSRVRRCELIGMPEGDQKVAVASAILAATDL